MIRKLLIVAASAFVLALVCLAAAWAIGGREFVKEGGWTIDGSDDDRGPRVERTLTFDPSRPLVLEAPVDVDFTKGDTVEMVVSGNPSIINRLRWQDGRLSLASTGKTSISRGTVHITITAPALPKVEVKGPGNLELVGLDQPELAVDISGAGNVEASGKVRKVVVKAAGAGNVDLTTLEAVDADVDLAGFGNADINASGNVNATVSGAGNISLHQRPKTLNSNINGIGNIDHDY